MRVLLFCIIYCFSAIFSAEICDIKKCPNYSLWVHYRELNCTPVYDLKSEVVKCCPIAYDCEALNKIRANPKKCYLNGNEYNIQDNIPKNNTPCSVACRCSESRMYNYLYAEISCPIVDCPEYESGLGPKPGCYFTNDFQHCCSTGEICPEKENNPKRSCEVDGKTYLHGQFMNIQSQKCSQCLCTDGKSECKPSKCNIEIHYAPRLASGFGIVYSSRESCCPFGFISPSSIVKVDDRKVVTTQDSNKPQCKLGDLLLNIGEEVTSTETTSNTKCLCLTPPIVTCINNP